MSQPDDIDKLLREIDAMNARSGTGPALPAPAQNKAIEPATSPSSGSGRVAWAGASAIGGLLVGGVTGTILTFLPSVSTVSTAVGAALGAAGGRVRQRPARLVPPGLTGGRVTLAAGPATQAVPGRPGAVPRLSGPRGAQRPR